MKKNGFISTTLIYTFFILFLLLMLFLLNSYSSIRFLLERYKYEIKDSFAESSVADINLYIMVWDNTSGEYELQDNIPIFGYYYEPSYSYCKNGSTISYVNGNVSITAIRKDSCYAYFREADSDIVLKIYTKESANSNRVLVKNIPSSIYKLTSQNCTKGTINFNENTRKFVIQSNEKTECEVEFTKKEMDIVLNIYKQDAYGSHEYNGLKYQLTSEIPGINYSYNSYKCINNDVNTVITEENGELVVESSGKNECNVYYNGGTNNVELIAMQETDTGVSGYTTGKKYTKTSTIPGLGYKYVGYICDDVNASVTYSGGMLSATINGTVNKQAVCRAYFDRYVASVVVNYYLETSSQNYESVVSVPNVGYEYNASKSSCVNGSEIEVNNNIVTVESLIDDECNVYYDMTNTDIRVSVYVLDRTTNKYELSNVPVSGYELYSAGCTNGASIEYVNSALKVISDAPTVCTVYFR